MLNKLNIVLDYGWNNVESPCSQSYIQKQIVDALRKINAQRVLDLGCGNGALSHYLQNQGFSVVGCDADRGGAGYGFSRDIRC